MQEPITIRRSASMINMWNDEGWWKKKCNASEKDEPSY